MAQSIGSQWRTRAEVRRDDWLRDGVVSGFVATFAMTVAVAAAYGLGTAVGDESGGRLERWFWALVHNPVTRRTEDALVLGIGLNLLTGVVLALVYGRLVEPSLGGPGWRKGIIFALVPWLLSVVAFLPIMGGGFAGADIDAGPLPLIGNLLLHLVYGVVLGSVYAIALESGLEDTAAERANAAAAARGSALGIGIGAVVGLVLGWVVGPSLEEGASRGAIALTGALVFAALGLLVGSLLGMNGSKARP